MGGGIDTQLRDKLRAIKLIVLDVDGVLTDGSIIYAGADTDIKAFHVQDGFGITLARQAGLKTAVLTGRIAAAVERRVKELKVDFYECGHFHKIDALRNIMRAAGADKSQTLYVGDDILDLACSPHVGVFVAPANATPRVRREAAWVTTKRGGDAAVREMIDALLDAQGALAATEDYFLGANQ
ncbi:MAG TPA: HAD hydrolase family protein [Burkholderiales bacterium]|jgi:3-deoxy-D-manno-octulosonate 8-phosphate phosphatase (KDO 8-P phosphatase)